MIRSLYNSASALHVLNRQHEQTANNLANVNTSGYRRVHISVAERSGSHHSRDHFGFGPEIEQRNVDFSQGRLVETRRPLDVAISGDGFFALQGTDGQKFYTKNGRFFRDVESGQLRSDNNLPVLGRNGPINIPPTITESQISIGHDGTIVAGDQQIGRFEIVSFEDNKTLVPVGQTLFRQSNSSIETDTTVQIQQKFQEGSNVNPTSELIGLIIGGRQYEAIQKATRAISDSLEQSIRA